MGSFVRPCINFAVRLRDDAYIMMEVLLVPDADVRNFAVRAKRSGIASLISFYEAWDPRLSGSAPFVHALAVRTTEPAARQCSSIIATRCVNSW